MKDTDKYIYIYKNKKIERKKIINGTRIKYVDAIKRVLFG